MLKHLRECIGLCPDTLTWVEKLFWIRTKIQLGSIPKSPHTWMHTHANAHADLCRVCSLVVRSFSPNSFKMIQAAAASSTQPQWQGHVKAWRRMQATHLLSLMAFQLLRAERDGDPAYAMGSPGPISVILTLKLFLFLIQSHLTAVHWERSKGCGTSLCWRSLVLEVPRQSTAAFQPNNRLLTGSLCLEEGWMVLTVEYCLEGLAMNALTKCIML